jgi:hypothetical protein
MSEEDKDRGGVRVEKMRNGEDEDMEREKRLMCGIMNGGEKNYGS